MTKVATKVAANALVTTILPATNVPNALPNRLDFPIANLACVTPTDRKITSVMLLVVSATAKKISVVWLATNVPPASTDSPIAAVSTFI